MKIQSFTQSGRTYLRTESEAVSFRGVDVETLRAIAERLEEDARRAIRHAALIECYLNDETECSPEALRA